MDENGIPVAVPSSVIGCLIEPSQHIKAVTLGHLELATKTDMVVNKIRLVLDEGDAEDMLNSPSLFNNIGKF